MAKIELGKVIDLIIKEDNAGVDALLENWFKQQTIQIHESIMEDDSIATDQNEIENEEYFGSNDLSEDEENEDGDKAQQIISLLEYRIELLMDVTGPQDPVIGYFKKLISGLKSGKIIPEDFNGKIDIASEIYHLTDEGQGHGGDTDYSEGVAEDIRDIVGGDYLDEGDETSDEDDTGVPSDLEDPDADEISDDVTSFSTDPDVIQDQFADVNADLERLEAEFDEIFGDSSSDVDIDDEEYTDEDEISEEVTDSELDADEDDMMNDLDDDDDFGPYDDLAEALKLDLVSIPDLEDEDGDEVGSGNDGIKGQNTKSPALQRGVDERFEGAGPVEIKSPNNVKGYPEFPKPNVKEGNGAKGTIRNKAEPLTNVPEGGDKSATLNKSFPKGNDKSILGDGADSREATIKKIARK